MKLTISDDDHDLMRAAITTACCIQATSVDSLIKAMTNDGYTEDESKRGLQVWAYFSPPELDDATIQEYQDDD